MNVVKGALVAVFVFPTSVILLAYMWRHPVGSIAVIGIIVVLAAASVYAAYQREIAPARELDDADTAKAQQEAARFALLDAWKPRGDVPEIDGQWPVTKPVAKHVRHRSGVGLKLNRD